MRTQNIITIIIALLGLLCAPDSGDAEASDASDDRKGYAVTESDPVRILPPTSGQTGGTFAKTYTFTVTDYDITQEDSYDFVRIPGSDTLIVDFKPVLPKFDAEYLLLPGDASVVSLRMTGGDSLSLGQLRIPNTAPWPSFPPSLSPYDSEYTDETDATGLYPDPNHWHYLRPCDDHQRLTIRFTPVQHNVDTRETTLWAEARVEVQYEVGEAVFISDFRADKDRFRSDEDITATATLENVGDTYLSGLTAMLILKKSHSGEVLSSGQQAVGNVPSGGTTEVTVSTGNGHRSELYFLFLEIRDEDGSEVASAADRIGIRSERISEVLTEESQAGDDVPITVVCENFSSQDITPEVRLTIEDSDGERVASFTMFGLTIPAGGYEDAVFFWDTSGRFTGTAPALPGRYCAKAELFMGFDSRLAGPVCFTLTSPDDLNQDLAVDMADFILAMKILVSENIDSAPPGSADPDGKIGLDNVLRILREIAEDMPVSPQGLSERPG